MLGSVSRIQEAQQQMNIAPTKELTECWHRIWRLERENAALASELRQCRAMLNDDERTEEDCIKILEPIVGYDREQPYAIRLSSAVRRLAQMVSLPNQKIT